MPEIMSHADWMKRTYVGVTSRRSETLKAVDTALLNYHSSFFTSEKERNLKKLKEALMRWIAEKGSAWRTSDRNRTNAVDTLHNQVLGIPVMARTGLADAALELVQAESKALLDKLFLNESITWRPGFWSILGTDKMGVRLATVGIVRGTKHFVPGLPVPNVPTPGIPTTLPGQRAVHAIATHAPGPLGSAAARVDELMRTIVPADIFNIVMVEVGKIMPTFVKDLTASIVPFVGVIAAGGGAAWATKDLIRDEYRRTQARMHAERSMSKETPEKAIQSVIQILEREYTTHSIVAAVGAAEFGGKLAGALADGGTATNVAIGLAASVARLANILRVIVRDVQEMLAANKAMEKSITISIFETSPIVGAYYVCCVPHSVLVNGLLEHVGKHGFNDQVERVISHHIEPLREQARRLIREHRFVITRLSEHPGVRGVNKKGLKAMKGQVGKSAMVGMTPEQAAAAELAEWNAVVARKRS